MVFHGHWVAIVHWLTHLKYKVKSTHYRPQTLPLLVTYEGSRQTGRFDQQLEGTTLNYFVEVGNVFKKYKQCFYFKISHLFVVQCTLDKSKRKSPKTILVILLILPTLRKSSMSQDNQLSL